MNKVYRLIWSAAHNAWVVGCEFATAKGKGKSGARGARRAGGVAGVLSVLIFAAEPASAWMVNPASITNPGTAASDSGQATNVAIGSSAVAGGQNSVSLGVAASATSNYSIALGNAALANASAGVAIGNSAIASAGDAVALGSLTFARGINSVALGDQVAADSTGSIAIQGNGGPDILGTAYLAIDDKSNNAIAIGTRATVSTSADSITLGTSATADTSANALALGINAKATSAASGVAIGNSAMSSAAQAVAIGRSAQAKGVSSTALGDKASATVANSVALGTAASSGYSFTDTNGVENSSERTVAIGTSASARSNDAIAIGSNTQSGGRINTGGFTDNTIAIGNSANAAGLNSLAMGFKSLADREGATAVGNGAKAQGNFSTVFGNNAAAYNPDGLALGNGSTVTGNQGIAAGVSSKANNFHASAIGNLAQANGNASLAIGDGASVGSAAAQGGALAIAIGRAATVADAAGGSVVMGPNATASAQDSVVIGNGAKSDVPATQSVTIGKQALAQGSDALAMGTSAQALGAQSVSIGSSSAAKSAQAAALGNNASASGANSLALGAGADTKSQVGAVALGAGSTAAAAVATTGATVAGTTYSFAGTAPGSTVSVGSVGNERTLTNVAAGRISGTSTDAINGSQLFATNTAIDNLDKGTVKYEVNPDGSINYSTVILNKGGDATTITNVAAGEKPSDAVNVSQLDAARTHYYSVNDGGMAGANYDNDGATGLNALAAGIGANGLGVSSVAMGAQAHTKGNNAIALGTYASAVDAGSMAIGASSEAWGATSTAIGFGAGVGGKSANNDNLALGTFAGINVDGMWNNAVGYEAGQRVTGQGNVSMGYQAGTDVTGSDNVAIANSGRFVESNYNTAVGYNSGWHVSGEARDIISLNGLETSGTFNTAVGNVSGSNVTGTDNMALGSTVGNEVTGSRNIAIGSNTGNHLTASDTIAVGEQSLASADKSIAIGAGTQAGAASALALGAGAQTLLEGGVAIGSGSSATVDKGVAGYAPTKASAADKSAITATVAKNAAMDIGSRQITSVAAGTQNSDAVNVAQLKSVESLASAGWNVTDGSHTANVGPNGKVTFSGDSNVTVTSGGAQDAGTVDVQLNKNLDLSSTGSLTIGNSKLDSAGLVITSGPSVTIAGIDAGSKKITNVKEGVADTDGVNVGQLKSEVDSAKTHYYSVNDGGVQQANFNNDGATGLNALAAGIGASGAGEHSVAMGVSAESGGKSSVALGESTQAGGEGSIALGSGAKAHNTGDVALGSGSETAAVVATSGATIAGTDYNFAGVNPSSTVSVGSMGKERTITNVAAGRLSGASTDAINGSQLFATNTAIDILDKGTVKYDVNPDGTINYTTVTLNKGGDATTITNVAEGVNPTDAVNVSQLNKTNQDVTNIYETGTKYFHANSTGADSQATGVDSVAIGMGAVASHDGSIALGAGSLADGSTLGSQAYLVGGAATGEVNIGDRRITGLAAGAEDADAVNVAQLKAVAASSVADAVMYDDASHTKVTLNKGGDATTITNVAEGVNPTDAVNVSQLNKTNQNVTNLGDTLNNFAGDQTTSYTELNGRGIRYVRTNDTGLALADAYAKGQASTAVGYNATSMGASSLALGRESLATGESSVAMGDSAAAVYAGDVALGAGSVTDKAVGTSGVTINGNTYGFAGAAPSSTVSVGRKGYERTITNVAAGRLSADSTDAVNGSQLYSTNQALNSLSVNIDNLDKGSVKYHVNGDGTVDYTHVILNEGGAATTISNVAAGEKGTDAVNVDQLNSTVAASKSHYYSVNDNGVQGGNYNNDGAQGVNSLAAGVNAKASVDGGVALGSDSVAGVTAGVAGYTPASTSADQADAIAATTSTRGSVSVGDASEGIYRQINGVAAGSADSDAVNVAQLKGAVGTATANAVSYDNSTHNTVTLNGDSYNPETRQGGTTITNVAAGVKDGDAVNMAQLNQTNSHLTNVTEGKDGMFQVNNTSNLPKPKPTGKDSVAGGAGAEAAGDNSVAVGTRSKATGKNSVALGNDSVASRDNSVSVSSAGAERQITNLAAGTADTDAVNLAQLNKAAGDINSSINNVYNDLKRDLDKQDDTLSAGIAGALAAASLPQPYVPGASMASVGAGNYRGQQALAIGLSRISDNGKWVTKLSGSMDSQGEAGVALGVGYQW